MTTRNYEAMFILDNNAATADFDATSGQVDEILQKHGAKLVQKEKWDERKLAYEIKGRRRGTYYLTYFEAAPDAISRIHEDVHLTENILRHLVIVLDLPIEEHIEKRNTERELLAEDSRKNSLGGWGDRRRSRGAPPPRKSEADDGDKPAEARTADAEPPAEARPAEARPVEAKASDAEPAEADPVEAKAVGPKAAEAEPEKTADDENKTEAGDA